MWLRTVETAEGTGYALEACVPAAWLGPAAWVLGVIVYLLMAGVAGGLIRRRLRRNGCPAHDLDGVTIALSSCWPAVLTALAVWHVLIRPVVLIALWIDGGGER